MSELQRLIDNDEITQPFEYGRHLITVNRFNHAVYEGRTIVPGRWYEVLAGRQSLGLIDHPTGQYFSFRPYEVGQALGLACSTFEQALDYLVQRA